MKHIKAFHDWGISDPDDAEEYALMVAHRIVQLMEEQNGSLHKIVAGDNPVEYVLELIKSDNSFDENVYDLFYLRELSIEDAALELVDDCIEIYNNTGAAL